MLLRKSSLFPTAVLALALLAGGCGIFGGRETAPVSGWMDGELLSIKHIEGVPILLVKIVSCSDRLEEMLGQQRPWPAMGEGIGALPGDRLRAEVTVSSGDAVVVKSIRKMPRIFVDRDIKIRHRWKGLYCGISDRDRIVIDNREYLEKYWEQINSPRVPRPGLPEIDFEKQVLVAALMGEFPTGGYTINVERITEKETEVQVHIVEIYPFPGGGVSQAFSRPYCLAVFEKTGKPIVFAERKVGGR